MTDVATEGGAEAAPTKGRAMLLVVLLLFIALVAGAVYAGLRDQHRRHRIDTERRVPQTEQAVLAAARAESVALTSLSYQTANQDLDRILAGATGQLKSRFASERAQLPKTLQQGKSSSRGNVLSSGLAYVHGSTAQAVIAVDATVTGTDTSASGVLKHYRMVVTLQRVGNAWLANDVAFAGQP